MKLFSRLRQVALEHQRLLRLQNSLAQSVIAAVCANQRYLQVTLENEHGQCQEGFVDITDWLAAQRAALPGMPWREIPLDYLCPLLQESVGSVALYGQTWTLRAVRAPSTPLPAQWLTLPVEEFTLHVSDWPVEAYPEAQAAGAELSLLPFELRCVLGRSRLPAVELAKLDTGDLLVITQPEMYLAVNGRAIFSCHQAQSKEIIVDNVIDPSIEDTQAQHTLPLFDWSRVPVTVEFVLEAKSYPLAELDNLQPGTAFDLSENVEKNIKIFLNQQLVGQGELVALADDRLAVEITKLNTFKSDKE
ncbi:Type III secretion apparatus [Sodalis praecaptivus]|uniref:Surface presentation of antigens protein SpaO n=1 Tax=Sodalis praecaptivus TaxID=1239307 RepID=W0HWE5_9GAMM|nr:FliM/FliN family flagellar motor switch protein [Sodalis praecaptivus]AHF78186.1 Type III secretion apparatus [Sodalis praecaptivus]